MKIEAKKYLQRIKSLDASIEIERKKIEDLENILLSVGGIDYSRDRVQVSPSNDQIIKTIFRLEEKKERYVKRIEKYINEKEFIISQIQEIEDTRYKQLLSYRYIDGMSLEEISKKMCYECGSTRNLHKSSLIAFEEKYKSFLNQ